MSLLSQHSSRTKIWQLEDAFHCSIVGTCLTLNELDKLANKLKLSFETKLSDYDLHHVFVHLVGSASFASRRIQKFLDEKYQSNIKALNTKERENNLYEYWLRSKENGEVTGAFWALVTHPFATKKLKDILYADIHMLSHLSGATIRIDMQELSRLRKDNQQLKKDIEINKKQTYQRINEKNSLINTLKKKLQGLEKIESENKQLKQALNHQKDTSYYNNNQIKKLENKLSIETEKRFFLEKRLSDTTKEMGILETKLTKSLIECQTLEATLNQQLKETCPFENNNMDLCGRCVLYVGGHNNLCNHFKVLVEKNNGEFIHHDGGREEGPSKLNSTLQRADIIFCPVDCISHKAINQIKRYCEKNTKSLTFLPKASLSAFTIALNQFAT